MMLIVRLYPTKGFNSLWRSLEKHIDSLETSNYVALYASQLSGNNFISMIFELKKLEDIEEFYTNALIKIPNIRKTTTLTLMKTRYFETPKDRSKDMKRFLIHINADPKHYSTLYEKIYTFKYPKNIILTYLSYSFGDDDLLVSVFADPVDSVMSLCENKFIKFPGVNSVRFTHVIRSMLLVSKDRWKTHLEKYLVGDKGRRKKTQSDYDWGFDDLAGMTGGFVGE